jgi:NADPH:quinone reductase-like Zn-dependent oxidoreductase
MRAIVVSASGGPEVLVPGERPDPVPGPGEVLVDVAASGVNFIDVYYRTGAYAESLPYVPGVEGAGTVAAVGEGVGDVAVGDRVAWSNVQGSYAERAVVPADKLVPVPDAVGLDDAAAALLQGMTAHYLTRSVHEVKPGDTVLVHAAAGGKVPPFDPQRLNAAGSLFLTRPTLAHYTATREELLERASDVYGWIASVTLELHIGKRYGLADAAAAHADLEARRTTGKLLLVP